MRYALTPVCVALGALLIGCAIPVFDSAGLPTAKIKLSHPADICVNGERHALVAGADGYAAIPSGRRVHLISKFSRPSAHCQPWISLVPQLNARYQMYTQPSHERCWLTLMREDASVPAGVRLDDTAEPFGNSHADLQCPRS